MPKIVANDERSRYGAEMAGAAGFRTLGPRSSPAVRIRTAFIFNPQGCESRAASERLNEAPPLHLSNEKVYFHNCHKLYRHFQCRVNHSDDVGSRQISPRSSVSQRTQFSWMPQNYFALPPMPSFRKTHSVSQRVLECGSPLPLMRDAAQGGVAPARR